MTRGAWSAPGRPWWRRTDERWLVIGALAVRLVFVLAWPEIDCVRDECLYLRAARRLANGQGITATNGWLWAPGYIALLALHRLVFLGEPGTIKLTQCALGAMGAVVMRRLAEPLFGRRAALVAALLWALSPTLSFFAGFLWTEGVYAPLLLLVIHRLMGHRRGRPRPGLTGLLLGGCVLLRGVTLWMIPALLVGLLVGRWRQAAAWRGALAVALGTVLAVAPYSAWATWRFGALVFSDRTAGQMMWLGNNDFPPLSFDWGLGPDDREELDAVFATGRPHCAPPDDPIVRDRCEREAAIAWIRAHPGTFLRRIPVRLAQLANPHSFLTRHLRWGRLPGIPPPLVEVLVALVAAWSLLAELGGPAAAFRFRHGPEARALLAVVVGLWLTNAAAIALTAGLSRYRVPLDPLWFPWLGALWATFRDGPDGALPGARPAPWTARRLAAAILVLAPLATLALRYLPVAWTG